jgi:hypothetical protein
MEPPEKLKQFVSVSWGVFVPRLLMLAMHLANHEPHILENRDEYRINRDENILDTEQR